MGGSFWKANRSATRTTALRLFTNQRSVPRKLRPMRPVLLGRNLDAVEDGQIRGREAKIDRLQIRIELRRGGRPEEDHVGRGLAGDEGESDGVGRGPQPLGDGAERTASLLGREPPVRERLLD